MRRDGRWPPPPFGRPGRGITGILDMTDTNTWRIATDADIPALRDHFQSYLTTSMFLLGNLEQFGLHGDHRNACTYWMLDTAAQGVVAISNGGMVMMQAPDACADDWAALPALLRGRHVKGVIGDNTQADAIMSATSWNKHPLMLNVDEAGFDLALSDLVMPDWTPARLDLPNDPPSLRPLQSMGHEAAIRWRKAYVIETGMAAPSQARHQAEAEVDDYIANDTHRVLMQGDTPLGVTGTNTRAGSAVQVGGVYTPPVMRGAGIARLAVARHMAELRDAGATHSILFAANAAAARAYQAIGFERSFTFAWRLYSDPWEVT